MALKLSPVDEYVQSSTPVMRAPSEIGKVDLTCERSMPCSTTACECVARLESAAGVRQRYGACSSTVATFLEVALLVGGAVEGSVLLWPGTGEGASVNPSLRNMGGVYKLNGQRSR